MRAPRLTSLLLLPGLVALGLEPALWLTRTWTDGAYDSDGAWVAAGCVTLVILAVRSGRAPRADGLSRDAGLLLGISAMIRLLGRVLAINHLGAFALVLDVWALGLALNLAARPWPVSPAALAGLFAFALPAEQVLQRLLAHPLRLVSAAAAEVVLRPFYPDMSRAGTLLDRPGLLLSVDLPCSGAQGLVLLGTLWMAIGCRRDPGLLGWAMGGFAALLGALLANTLRVGALFVAPSLLAEPGHSLTGLVALAVGAAPLLALARRWPTRARRFDRPLIPLSLPPQAAAVFSAAAVVIALAPHQPLDVSEPAPGPGLPVSLGAWYGTALPLSDQEQVYFQRFGGRVEKVSYRLGAGTITALTVRTTAPLRHLHDPDRCLRGAGHAVERLGVRSEGLLTTTWKSVDPDGNPWRVEATFINARGEVAASGSDVAWRWMAEPGVAWMLLERISPWGVCEDDPAVCRDFEQSLLAALDLVEVSS
ncbi:MAG: exosortase T [Alphaproteobacteria bacterium]|nr:exosortase T [Alphaproteobacteria bacterium]